MNPRFRNQIRNYSDYIEDKAYLKKKEYCLSLKNGLKIFLRPRQRGVVSDIDIFDEVILNDVYSVVKEKHRPVVVDIGAQIGSFSLLMSAKATRLYAIEPEPGNFSQLSKNVKLNGKKNIVCVKKAISRDGGKIRLFINKSNKGGHSIFAKSKECMIVNSVSLDDFMAQENLSLVDLMKIDCEGAEYDILLNASVDVLKRIALLILEVHKPIYQLVPKKELFKKLRASGFSLSIIKKIFYKGEGTFWIVRCERGKAK